MWSRRECFVLWIENHLAAIIFPRRSNSMANQYVRDVSLNIQRGNAFTEGALEVLEFKELKNPLVPHKAELEQQIAALERSKVNRLEPLRKWFFEANQAETTVSENNWLEM